MANGNTNYYHTNHLGSTDTITDELGDEVVHYEYEPYGQIVVTEGADSTDYKFTGKPLDDETGLYFYGARYYNPTIGRFITPDTTVQSPGNPITLNRYAYAGNNPVNNIDPDGHSFWKKIGNFFKQFGGTILSIAFTFVGMPFIGALVSSAFGTFANGGSFADFGIGLGIGIVAGYAGGTAAGKIGSFFEMNKAGLGLAAMRGGLSGAIGGAGSAAAYNRDIGRGAWMGAATGVGVGGAMWGMNNMRTNDFIKNNTQLDSSYTPDQKAAVLQSIREAGQSPVGGRLMSKFIKSGTTLNLAPEWTSPFGANLGPHVATGTNDMYFDGDVQGRFGSYFAGESWGPSLDDGSVFTHEMGHTASGFAVRDPLNVSVSENLYRGWNGAPARHDYGVLSQGGRSQPVPKRSILEGLTYTW